MKKIVAVSLVCLYLLCGQSFFAMAETGETLFENNLPQTESGAVLEILSEEPLQETGATVEIFLDPSKNGSGMELPETGSGQNVEPEKVSNPIPLILLNEVMPNPLEGKEWVEIWNAGETSIDLNGWQIADAVKVRLIIEKIQINPGEFIVFEFYNILNNDGDTVILSDNTFNEMDRFEYGNAIKGQSFGRESDNQQIWKNYPETEVTRGSKNFQTYAVTISEVKQSLFYSSGAVLLTWDAVDDSAFRYYQLWQKQTKGEEKLVSQFKENQYQLINLTLGQVYQYILKACNQQDVCTGEKESRKILIKDFLGVRLNEVFANAEGSDEGKEWIELKYNESQSIDWTKMFLEIEGKRLDLADLTATGGYLLVYPNQKKITLKNTNGTIYLKHIETTEPLDELIYTEAQENWA